MNDEPNVKWFCAKGEIHEVNQMCCCWSLIKVMFDRGTVVNLTHCGKT